MNKLITIFLLSVTSLGVGSFTAIAEPVLQGQIVIETRISPPDPVSGMKSTQRILILLDSAETSLELRSRFETGTTFGLPSVRNEFSLNNVQTSVESKNLSFDVRGQTASGVLVLPDIDYKFSIRYDWSNGQNSWQISGCHDGYPGYRIWIENSISGEKTDLYRFDHGPKELFELLGRCDIVVQENLNFPD